MIPTPPSARCEEHALSISAFLDGELPFPDCLPAVDHLASCEDCRRFYAGARRLAERLVEAPAAPAPESAWERIAGAGASPRAGRPRGFFARRNVRALGLAAAAVLAVAVGVSRFRTPSPAGASPDGSPAPLREIVVEGARGRMTDERFLSLLSELLSADSRYHRETERVLRFVLRREDRTDAGETAVAPNEETEAAEGEEGEAPRPVRTPVPLAS